MFWERLSRVRQHNDKHINTHIAEVGDLGRGCFG